MNDTKTIGLVMIGAGVLLKSWLLAGGGLVVVLAVQKGTLPATLPSGATTAFKLQTGVNNGGQPVTPSPDLSVQAWPGAYES